VALMLIYQLVITGLGGWLMLQALQLQDRGTRRAFMFVAVPIMLCAAPLAWVTVRRLLELRRHPEVGTERLGTGQSGKQG
jgi:hypothetical protein